MVKKDKNVSFTMISIFVIVPLLCILGMVVFFGEDIHLEKQYTTTNITDYGNYIGNYDNERVEVFINSFFPKQIEDYFTEIEYSYRAKKGDTCAFEAYLEFVVEDSMQYEKVLADYTEDIQGNAFSYDSKFTEYVYYDCFDLVGSLEEQTEQDIESGDFGISGAVIGKILCCAEEQRIIFVALGVYDGGMAGTEYLDVYFERFEIDPWEYERTHPFVNGEHNPLA